MAKREITDEEIERLGHELSGGFGLWGTIDDLDPSGGTPEDEGGRRFWTKAKHRALVAGWIAGCESLGFTKTDAAALGDYKLGRWYVDQATDWLEKTPAQIRKLGEKAARRLVEGYVKQEGGGSVKAVKEELLLNYTDYYPHTSGYVRRFDRIGRE
jgi:hypothetical protein